MPAQEIVALALMGLALIALGFTAGPLASLKRALQAFRDPLYGSRLEDQHRAHGEQLPGQLWVAVGGAAVVLLALAAYLTGR